MHHRLSAHRKLRYTSSLYFCPGWRQSGGHETSQKFLGRNVGREAVSGGGKLQSGKKPTEIAKVLEMLSGRGGEDGEMVTRARRYTGRKEG